jgi:hypothetical protein
VPNTVPLPAKDVVMIGESPSVSNIATHFTKRKEFRENRAKIGGGVEGRGTKKKKCGTRLDFMEQCC